MINVSLLLDSWKLGILQPRFSGITLDNLRTMTEEDLSLLFPTVEELNLKCTFRKNLINWRKAKGYINTDSPTLNNTRFIIPRFTTLDKISESVEYRVGSSVPSAINRRF